MSPEDWGSRDPIDLILVEDSASDAELIADALAEAGLAIAVRRVEDESALRAAFDERLPDAILADWTLPRYSGLGALALAHERCPEVPLIFVSGTIPESAAFEALREGATDYVLKHNLHQLGSILMRALHEVWAQRSLRDSLAFNRAVLDSVSAEIAVVDRDGLILAVNRPWERFALENAPEPGQPAAGTGVGANYLAVCQSGTDDASNDDAAGNGIRAVLDGRRADFHMEFACHSPQQERWFHMGVTPLARDSGGAVITHTNITQRKQSQLALQKSRDLLQCVLDSAPARVFWKDRQSRYLGCNSKFANDAGYAKPDALIGKTDFDMGWADHADLYRDADRTVMESGRPKLNYEELQTTPDGNTICLRTSKIPLRDETDEVIGILGVYQDITTEKRNANELQRHRHHLEELVTIRTRELECARSAADLANRAKSDFLSGMTHELRTPLNAILGFAQLLEFDAPRPTPAQQDSITQIVRAGWHLLGLINEILALAKAESALAPLNPLSLTPLPPPVSLKPVLLNEVIRECRDMIAPYAQQHGIRVTIPRGNSALVVSADHTRVKQVLINLLSNAIKYNRPQGTVEVDCAATTPGRLRVSVRDTGVGLAREQLAQLFQAFNRLGQDAGGEEGTGIGLVLVKRYVELMGGIIGVDSALGMGSTFWFELSAVARSMTAPADANDAGSPLISENDNLL